MNINEDIKTTSEIQQYRIDNKLQKVRGPYTWWENVFVILTFSKKPLTAEEILDNISRLTGQTFISKAIISSQLRKLANYEPADPKARNYAQKLPHLAYMCELSLNERKTKNRGRSAAEFYFKNNSKAQNILVAIYPKLNELVKLIQKRSSELKNEFLKSFTNKERKVIQSKNIKTLKTFGELTIFENKLKLISDYLSQVEM